MKLKSLILIALVFALFSFKTEKTKLNGTYKIVSEEIVRQGESTYSIKTEKNNGLKIKKGSGKTPEPLIKFNDKYYFLMYLKFLPR